MYDLLLILTTLQSLYNIGSDPDNPEFNQFYMSFEKMNNFILFCSGLPIQFYKNVLILLVINLLYK